MPAARSPRTRAQPPPARVPRHPKDCPPKSAAAPHTGPSRHPASPRSAQATCASPARSTPARTTPPPLLDTPQARSDIGHERDQPLLDLRRGAHTGRLLGFHNSGHATPFASAATPPSTPTKVLLGFVQEWSVRLMWCRRGCLGPHAIALR